MLSELGVMPSLWIARGFANRVSSSKPSLGALRRKDAGRAQMLFYNRVANTHHKALIGRRDYDPRQLPQVNVLDGNPVSAAAKGPWNALRTRSFLRLSSRCPCNRQVHG